MVILRKFYEDVHISSRSLDSSYVGWQFICLIFWLHEYRDIVSFVRTTPKLLNANRFGSITSPSLPSALIYFMIFCFSVFLAETSQSTSWFYFQKFVVFNFVDFVSNVVCSSFISVREVRVWAIRRTYRIHDTIQLNKRLVTTSFYEKL